MSEKKLNTLLQWGQESGALIPNGIKFTYQDNKGICCLTTEEVNHIELKIPSELIISKHLLDNVFPDELVTSTNNNTLLKLLVARMMYDRSSENESVRSMSKKFKPYLHLLPEVIDSPLVWNPSELALLSNTNLGNSIKEKLQLIFKEWFDLVITNGTYFDHEQIKEELRIFKSFADISDAELYEQLLNKVEKNKPLVWYSFTAFLWSHLIFISRAFPEYVVNKSSSKSDVVLLPIIDLLNHDYNTKVEWLSDNDGSFCYRNLNSTTQGVELYNNYGGKGNEELLSGYGFVLEENIFDSVALKMKLADNVIETIVNDVPELKLPTMDDYTWFAFDKNNKKDQNFDKKAQYDDGIMYFINANNKDCLNDILGLFSFLSIRKNEDWKSLRAQLEAVQMLRNALEHKLFTLKEPLVHEEKSFYPIKPYRKEIAEIYRSGQIHVLKYCLSLLKKIEKAYLQENKNRLITMKKILKYDESFSDELNQYYNNKANDDVVFESPKDLLIVWILIKVSNNSFPDKYSSIKTQYTNFIKTYNLNTLQIPEEIKSIHQQILEDNNKISTEDTYLATEFIENNSFTRISSDETILVLI